MIYDGMENYIFISYAHKDSESVDPIIGALEKNGFRVWYDSGIEAGTEWPEYIEERLMNSAVVVVFMTPSAIESRNCRNEINFALELKKEVLVVYLEKTELLKGMRLQLNSTQSLFRNNHATYESFIKELINARVISSCRAGYEELDQVAPETSKSRSDTRISNICSIGTNDEYDLWPNGTYSQVINRDKFSVQFFHVTLLKPIGISGAVSTRKRIYNSEDNLVYDDAADLKIEAEHDKISTGWIIKGKDGTYIPSGKYRFVCSINNSPEFTYYFTITSNAEEKAAKKKSFFSKLMELFNS